MKTKVGQIFLTHPKVQNYTTLYQEAFSKSGESVELFMVMEIWDGKHPQSRAEKNEYEKLARDFVSAFKKIYITAPKIDQDTFERSLGSINNTLARIASRGKVSWWGKLCVGLAAIHKNELALSATGNAQVILARQNELTVLTEELTAESRASKIFSNYSTGRLLPGDRVIISTNQIFNYLSLERIKKFQQEETLEETCQEIIAALADIKQIGFATFIFELVSQAGITRLTSFTAPIIPKQKAKADISGKIIAEVIIAVLTIAWNIATGALKFIYGFFARLLIKRRGMSRARKKYFVIAAVLIVALLAVNIAVGIVRKSIDKNKREQNELEANIENKISEAEAALIYGDEKRVLALVSEIEQALPDTEEQKRKTFQERLTSLKDKIVKKVVIDSPAVLVTFPNIPTDLLRSPAGMIGMNDSSGTMSYYDFVTGEVRAVLKNENTSRLSSGAWLGGEHGFVFLNKSGQFEKLDLASDTLTSYESSGFEGRSTRLESLGEGNSARIYILDDGANQIWRIAMQESGPAGAERWFKEEGKITGTRDFAVDGSIYLLFPDGALKYFNGKKENFALSSTLPKLEEASRIFTKPDYDFLYITDPKNERILIFDKKGNLTRQLVGAKFRDVADIYVDEKNRIIYALSGSELLQVTLP